MTGAPTWAAALSSWAPSPALALPVLATAGYGRLVRRSVTGGGRPSRRVASWLLAMALLVVALNGPVAVYGEVLFWVHMVQHLLLIMVVPVLLVWAQPVRMAYAAAGVRARRRIDTALSSRPVRWVTGPLVGLAVYTAVVVLTHLTGFQQLSATNGWIRAGELALYLGSGWLLFWPLVGTEHGSWSVPYFLRFVLLAVAMGADTLTGVVLMLTNHPLAPAYAAAHPGWGPNALADQEIAGAIMWVGGDILMMLLMILAAVQWSRAEERGLGSWLEGARRRALLGTDAGQDMDVDDDQRALDAYNATLAALHRRQPPETERRGHARPPAGSSPCAVPSPRPWRSWQ